MEIILTISEHNFALLLVHKVLKISSTKHLTKVTEELISNLTKELEMSVLVYEEMHLRAELFLGTDAFLGQTSSLSSVCQGMQTLMGG